MMMRWVGWVGCVLALGGTSCSGDDLSRVGPAAKQSNAGSAAAAKPSLVTGVRLAHVDVTSTHQVEFWETRPGRVLMLQKLNQSAGDRSLELGPMLRNAGGTYGGLYRKLLNDENALLSPEILAADARRRQLPVRDASLPLPPPPSPRGTPRSHGPAVTFPARGTAQPGALKAQSLINSWISYDSYNFDCDPSADGSEVDKAWCPDGYFAGPASDTTDEAIFYDTIIYNPQEWPSDGSYGNYDLMSLFEWDSANGTWVPDVLFMDAPPDSLLRITVDGTPSYYAVEVEGAAFAFGESERLSFPQLTQVETHPGAGGGWVNSGFSNDIQGISHDFYGTYLSRTEYGISAPQYGVLGYVPYYEDLAAYAPDRNQYKEPNDWLAPVLAGIPFGYTHFGDIVYDDNTGYVFVGMNGPNNTNGGIGVFVGGGGPYRGSVLVSENSLGWLALNPKNGMFYASPGGTPIHQYMLSFPYSSNSYPPPVATTYNDLYITNAPPPGTSLDGINGGKVSRHGKLWVSTYQSLASGAWNVGLAEVWGIDPYSGLIQTVYPVELSESGLTFTSLEVEGLDITDPNLLIDTVVANYRPGISGQIHVQVLGNRTVGNDGWKLLNFSVSDLDRL